MKELQKTISAGFCQCGCGRKTPVATITRKRLGHVIGRPVQYIQGHNNRGTGIMSSIEDAYLVNHETGCWEWLRYKTVEGYGRVRNGVGEVYAHRYMYELLTGPIPEGLHLDHLCSNPSCVNPSHLEPVTNAENTRRGAAAKLTLAKAEEIRLLYLLPGNTMRRLAKVYGIHHSQICLIVNNQAWQTACGVIENDIPACAEIVWRENHE